MPESTAVRSKYLNIRIRPEEQALFKEAASAQNKTLSDFVLDAVRGRIQDDHLDKRHISLNANQFKRFQEALDTPPEPNEKLASLLNREAPWER